MPITEMLRHAARATVRSASVFARDVGAGMLVLSHNTLAAIGLLAVATLVLAFSRADVRQQAEVLALDWLQGRHEQRATESDDLLVALAEPLAVARATAASLQELPRSQATLASWIARRYRVAPEPVAALVQEAWQIGERAGLDPTLILAIMAVESSFNPFAQSTVGAQGLMQVMTRVHNDKYAAFGGTHAAFDPISNLRVGVQVLKECIRRAGSVREGLRYYVGAALLESDGGYADRVLAEQTHMLKVAQGERVPPGISNRAAPTTTLPTLPDASAEVQADPGIDLRTATGASAPLPANTAKAVRETTAASAPVPAPRPPPKATGGVEPPAPQLAWLQ